MSQHNPVSPVQEGQILAGKYRVSHVIAVGGMGVVVAATHVQLDQIVALKFVHPTAAQNPAAVERFLREARSAVRLRSEHVAKVLDVGTLDSGMPFIVMEFLEGADLGRVLQTGGPLSIESATDFVLQACEAVAEAHSIGLVHRDLKPQNLFLTKRVGGAPLVKVLDFGISKMTVPLGSQPSLTQTATFTGSPFYMAPEQMRSTRVVDPRTDIWALGVVLFELLTTRVPFEAETVPELCLKIAQDPPRSLEELRPDVPLGLAQLVSRCLQKDPAMRFADAAELASALEPFATAASRHIAERTRRIVSGFRSTAPSIPPSLTGSGPRLSARSHGSGTPAPWHETNDPPGKVNGGRSLRGVVVVSALVVGTALLFFIGARALAPAGGSGPSQSASNAVTVPAPLEVPRASNGAALGGQVAGQVANQPSNQAMGQGQALAQPVAQTQHVEPPTSEAASEPTRLAPPNTATTTTTAPAARGAAAPDAGRAVVMPVKGASARTTHTSATGSNHDDDIPTMR